MTRPRTRWSIYGLPRRAERTGDWGSVDGPFTPIKPCVGGPPPGLSGPNLCREGKREALETSDLVPIIHIQYSFHSLSTHSSTLSFKL